MRRKRNEFAIGASVSIATFLVIFAVLFLEQPAVFSGGIVITITTPDAMGIGTGNEIHYRGVKVGTVQAVKFGENDIVITGHINSGIKIPEDSQFEITSSGLLSGTVVKIIPGNSSSYLTNGTTVQASAGSGLSALSGKANEIGTRVNSVLQQIQQFPEQQIGTQMEQVLGRLRSAIKNLNTILNDNSRKVSGLVSNLDKMAKNNRPDVAAIVSEVKKSSSDFAGTVSDARIAARRLDNILTALETGQGSLGRLLNDPRLYHNVNQAVLDLDTLINDVKKNPGKYVSIRIF